MARQRKRCKNCNKLFVPDRDFQKNCSYECDMEFLNKDNAIDGLIKETIARAKTDTNKKKLAFKQNDKSVQMEKAQQTFNKFIRLRDKDEPCVSCGYVWNENNYQRQAHASHFIAVNKSKALRFNEDNVWKSCQQCNTHLSGNLIEYRIRLIKKIGIEKVEELELIANKSTPDKYSINDYKDIIVKYQTKIKGI